MITPCITVTQYHRHSILYTI